MGHEVRRQIVTPSQMHSLYPLGHDRAVSAALAGAATALRTPKADIESTAVPNTIRMPREIVQLMVHPPA
jgi:hypothetical protein